MADREKVMRANEICAGVDCTGCPYWGDTPCQNKLAKDTFTLLKDLDKENKALRKLLDWAVECDFGLDNLGDWWHERFAEEIKGMGYTESLIHLARRYIEVFEGGDDDAE